MRYILHSILILLSLININTLHSQLLFNLGNQGETFGKAIAIDKDSNFIIAGTFQGVLNCDIKGLYEIESNYGGTDVFFAKYDKLGNIIWAKSFGSSGKDYPTSIEADKYGNIFLAGYFGAENVPGRFIDLDPSENEDNIFGPGGIDCFLIKVNKDGDYQWGFVLGDIKGNSTDIIWDISINQSGQVYIAGSFAGTIDFNPFGDRERLDCPSSNNGVFVAKYDDDGENMWASVVGANIISPLDEGYASIDLDNVGACVIAATFRDTAHFEPDTDSDFQVVSKGKTDIFIAKYSNSGRIQIRNSLGGKEQDLVYPGALRFGYDGYIYMTGNYLGKSDFYPGFGTSYLENTGQGANIFLASYSVTGAMRWAIGMDSPFGADAGTRIAFDNENNVLLTGWFSGTTNFDSDAGFELTSNGTDGAGDIFLAKYDSYGRFLWANNFGGNISGKDKYGQYQQSFAAGLTVDNDDNAIITGMFYGLGVDFDPSDNYSLLSASKLKDLFVAKYDYDGFLWFDGGGRPVLRILSPNGGEIWNIDSLRNITWYSRNVDSIEIEYSVDDGIYWETISESVSASSGSFSWLVEAIPSEECRIRITNKDDAEQFDVSNGLFTITNEIKPIKVLFTYGGPGDISGRTIVTDSENNFYVAAMFQGTINADAGRGNKNLTAFGNKDMILAKYNDTGDLLWAYNVGNDGAVCEPNVMKIDKNNNLFVAGFFGKQGNTNIEMDFDLSFNEKILTALGGYDAFLAKYDKDGKYLWAISLGNESGISIENIVDISVDNAGNIFATGIFSGSVDFNYEDDEDILLSEGDGNNIFLAKYNSAGDYRWAIAIDAKFDDVQIEGLTSVRADELGGCYLLGNFRDTVNFDPARSIGKKMYSAGETDVFLAHYKNNKYLDWAIQTEGENIELVNSGSLELDNRGRLIITGQFNSKTDFYPGLIERSLEPSGNEAEIFIASYRSSGDLQWVNHIATTGASDAPEGLAIDTSGNIIVSGIFRGTSDFDMNDGSATITSLGIEGAADIFLAKYNSDGAFLWVNHFGADTVGSGNTPIPYDIAIDKKSNIYLTGEFHGLNVDFEPGEDISFLSSQYKADAFIAKYYENGELWIQQPDTAILSLKTPNGNELWQVGANYDIVWQSEYINFLTIQYSTDSGVNWITIADSVAAANASYSWLIPNTPSGNCKILIFDPSFKKRMDYSSNEFTITDRTIILESPNGGEEWFAGSRQYIKWTSSNINQVDILYSVDAGISWKTAVTFASAASSSYSWQVRNIPSDSCLVKIIGHFDTEIFDISDNFFSIKPSNKALTLLTPNGAETWLKNNIQTIEWNGENIDYINLEFSVDNGLNWTIIKDSILSENEMYDWLIDNTVPSSDSCLIRISDHRDLSIFDISDSVFVIDIEDNVNENDNPDFVLYDNYPDPFAEKTIISFELKKRNHIIIEVFDETGSKVAELINEILEPSHYYLEFDGSKLQQGMYIYRLTSNSRIAYGKMIIIK